MSRIEEELKKAVKKRKEKCVLNFLLKDSGVNAYLDQANKLAILRLGYNDHGKVHSEIVALNALKIFDILCKNGYKPNIITEGIGNEEDVRIVLLLGAFLHDIGCSVCRDDHDLIGVIISQPIVDKILKKIYKQEKMSRISCFVFEAIACHMGNQEATSLEAKIVEVADSTDIAKGRARIPFHIGVADIHKFSALAIEEVKILEGEKKPVRFEVFMDNPAGIFQTEETMLKKIKDARFENVVELVARIKGEKALRYL